MNKGDFSVAEVQKKLCGCRDTTHTPTKPRGIKEWRRGDTKNLILASFSN